MREDRKRYVLERLVDGLCAERGVRPPATTDVDELWTAFRALVNTRPAIPADAEWLAMQDELLEGLINEKGVATPDDAEVVGEDPRLRLWRGDITTLAVDAIVNAANSQMLGCWVPGHHCIDNAIHTYAGVQLRAECAHLMEAQGTEEPTGAAKATDAYNLPARRVIHTVGPIAGGHPTNEHRAQLASCYQSCLDLCASENLRSVAFCCISTGIFGFPQAEAAGIAVRTVRAWLASHDEGPLVVFNVFTAEDEALYRALLSSC